MSITIPAPYVGMDDAQLEVESDEYGDSYAMTLRAADGHVIASASGFRPGAAQDFGDDHAVNTAGTFGAFLANALDDPEARDGWVLADDASDWSDALAMMEDPDEPSIDPYEPTGGDS